MKNCFVFRVLSCANLFAHFSCAKLRNLKVFKLISFEGLKTFAASKGNVLDKDALTVTNLHLISQIICVKSAKRLFTKIFPKALKHSGAVNYKTFKPISLKRRFCPAFSLVEMLMALLVASLLLAALAPVMTKKFGETVNISGSGGVKSDYQRIFYEDFEWTVPNGVNVIKVTSIGGGGAGGGASYGYQEFTSTTNDWIVPDGVTKLRVFMVGAGGSGASGGSTTNWAHKDIPSLSNAEGEILTAGSYTFASGITPPDSYTAPELDTRCKSANFSDKWTIVSDGTEIDPMTRFSKFEDNTNISITKATACGGGGADSTGSVGGSGGYIENVDVGTDSTAISTLLVIGGNGTGNKGGYPDGSSGASRIGSYSPGSGGDSNGGGGGGSTTLTVGDYSLIVGGGGGGGGHGSCVASCTTRGGNGGAGGGGSYGGKGGGGAAGGSTHYAGSGGASGAPAGSLGNGAAGYCSNSSTCWGGNGGAGGGGVGGGKGTLSTIFGSNNCNANKPGAIKLWYSADKVEDGLKCQYSQPANSGGGGGAGQIWIGEISVTPGQKLDFNIGIGGAKTVAYSKDGEDGGSTSISLSGESPLISVSGGNGGKFETEDTSLSNSYGLGGGIKTISAIVGSNVVKDVNWKGTNFHNGGENGGVGKTPANGAGGGKGGQLYNLEGVLVKGGTEGGAQSNGSDAVSTDYGAGGGGGGGVINEGGTPGHGGKGANGYIFIEWGKTNGGGGATGQVVEKKAVWVTPGTKIKISIGKGGEAREVLTSLNGVNGFFGQKGNNGGDSFIETSEGIKATAKGGEGGYPGTSVHGFGGNCDTCSDKIDNSIKGEDGSDNYGGIGGSITKEICPLFDSLMGLGGCGGNMPDGICANASSSGIGKNAGKAGGGGGGGAVKDDTAYTGGKGADGMVVIEWSN